MPSSATETSLLDPTFLRKLERLAIAAKQVQLGATKGERKSRRKGISTEFADYRDYVQGDDLRHVDWNIYGRLESLYLKLYQEHEDMTLHVLLDASQSMEFGSPSKFLFARQLAAAIGYIGLAGYDRVALDTVSGTAPRGPRPMRGKGNAARMFSWLDSLQAGGGTALADGCRSHAMRNRGKGVILLISDFMDESGHENAIRQLLATRCEVYCLQVLAPEELDPSLAGDLKLVDSETQAFAEITVSRALMKRYRQNRDAFVEQVRDYCVGRGIGHFLVSSSTPIEEVTLNILRRGGVVR